MGKRNVHLALACLRAGALALAFAQSPAAAADYPLRPVSLLVASTPGGSTDTAARLLAERMSQVFGKRFVVENRPGANGTISAAALARAPADGHTLLFSSNQAFTLAPHVMKTLPYDPLADFAPVTQGCVIQLVLVAHPSLGAATLAEFIAAARKAPGRIQYASGGEGSDHHLAMELLQIGTGIRLDHVPYKAGPLGYADVLGGHVMAMFIVPGTAARHVKEGRVVALGVASARPIDTYPGVPPISSVLPGYEFEAWLGLNAPRGTPPEVIARLNAEARAALASPEIAAKMTSMGLVPRTGTPEELAALVQSDHRKYGKLIREIGLATR